MGTGDMGIWVEFLDDEADFWGFWRDRKWVETVERWADRWHGTFWFRKQNFRNFLYTAVDVKITLSLEKLQIYFDLR